jgi:hypothetical protein
MTITSKLAFLAVMVPGLMIADITYTYSITAPGLNTASNPPTEDGTWNLTFQFVGPEMYNAADNTLLSFLVTGTPANGWTENYNKSYLTSYGSDGAAVVTFNDTNSPGDGLTSDGSPIASVTYTFYGTDAFWATLGQQSFGATNDPSATSGAFFVFNPPSDADEAPPADAPAGGGTTKVKGDPPCTNCSVTTSVPEPGSAVLLAIFAGVFSLPLRKRHLRLG